MRTLSHPSIRTIWLNLALCLSLLLTWSQPLHALADDIPESALVSGFIGHAQSYPLSCEARSAVDWMAYWGVYTTEAEFFSRLPASDNPDAGFVGNVDDLWGNLPPRSYGVHAEPIAALLREYGFQAEAKRGASWDDLRSEIAAGRPVIVWVIGQMWRGVPETYTSSDGSTTTVARFEHTMALVGYDSSWVYVVDAFSGQAQTYALETFQRSWGVLENMAVMGWLELPSQPPEENNPSPGDSTTNTYLVQRGDYLVELASRFGTTWQELANLNNIPYPYTIYPGQVLDIPSSPGQAGAALPEPPVEQPPVATEPPPTETPTPTPTATPEPPMLLSTKSPQELIQKFYIPIIANLGEMPAPRPRGMKRQVFRKP